MSSGSGIRPEGGRFRSSAIQPDIGSLKGTYQVSTKIEVQEQAQTATISINLVSEEIKNSRRERCLCKMGMSAHLKYA